VADITRRIGLSLGADLCWPHCYEAIWQRLDPVFDIGGDRVQLTVERMVIEPFDLNGDTPYDVILDRVTHWYHTRRERLKKAVLMDGVYVLNSPWTIQSMEKQTSYCAMMRLGLPVPTTWLLPPKEYEQSADLEPTLQRYARLFDLGELGAKVGYPLFMKPYDGGAWKGVSRIDNEEQLRTAYEKSGRMVMHLQRSVENWDLFARCIGVGPQLRCVNYKPDAPLHDRYDVAPLGASEDDLTTLRQMTLTINAFFGWDFNSCEALRNGDGVWQPIDFANACPDSQVTSLHYHFPWLVIAKLKWSIFCAATKRRMRLHVEWDEFFRAAEETEGAPLAERLSAYAAIANERLDTKGFEAFCDEHLGNVDEIAWDYFGSDDAKQAVRQKVMSLFPEHEFDQFTELFWDRIQLWREHNSKQTTH
jgi:hypothetical protein